MIVILCIIYWIIELLVTDEKIVIENHPTSEIPKLNYCGWPRQFVVENLYIVYYYIYIYVCIIYIDIYTPNVTSEHEHNSLVAMWTTIQLWWNMASHNKHIMKHHQLLMTNLALHNWRRDYIHFHLLNQGFAKFLPRLLKSQQRLPGSTSFLADGFKPPFQKHLGRNDK